MNPVSRLARVLTVLLTLTLVNSLLGYILTGWAQSPTNTSQGQVLLANMTAEERVGQLFLVSFTGMNVDPESQIYDLIANHHIGGVILTAANDNFTDAEGGSMQLLTMIRQLQLNRWVITQPSQSNSSDDLPPPTFIPLFVGISQEGDGYPNDQIISGLTQLPNAMAMGATWDRDLVSQVGSVLGQELSSLGINLLLGPSLDVLENPQAGGGNDLGTRAFGGDPYWVGELGKSYISSVHQGANGKIAVIAKHFPGIGAADRLPIEEVATVRKSLDQLTNFDLVPFFNVTGNVGSEDATTDGLLVSHIRYQGFQGNIRASTRPISLDLQAFSQLMLLSPLTTWRETGGVMVSDDLGSPAVRRFYELTNPNQAFDAKRVALNAFLAGNDILYLGEITSSEDPDSYTTILNILVFFAQRYQEDPAFAQRVDESVLRIINLKSRMYPVFNLDDILPPLDGVATLGHSEQVVFNVAADAATLISPSLAELENALPDSPNSTDRIVFLTDVRTTQQCSQCAEISPLTEDTLPQAVLRLYGTQAGGQIRSYNLKSYSFIELERMLDGDPEMFQMERDLRRAQWQVISMLDVNNSNPASQAIYRYLSERPDLFQQKKLVVFAFNAPYFLDATDISKLTAYFGLYSKAPGFIDIAARLLFKEVQPRGALPVTVYGVGYDLISATMPDPSQIIPLSLDLPITSSPSGTTTPEPAPTPVYDVGDQIAIKAGVILDSNGNPVPDGTPVQFIITNNGEIISLPQTETTLGGIATTHIQVQAPGTLEIRAESEPAKNSQVIQFEIPDQNGPGTTQTPTSQPTVTPTWTPSPSPPPTVIVVAEPPPPASPNLLDWFLATGIACLIGFLSFRMATVIGQVRWGVRSGFLAVISGLLFYTLLAISETTGNNPWSPPSTWLAILVTIAGSAIGILAAWGWKSITSNKLKENSVERS